MSLQTDLIFKESLSADTVLMTAIGNRLYNTAIPVPDEQIDKVAVPYVIISFDGMNNQDTTKDDPYEGGTDQVTIGVTVVATTREKLAELTSRIRQTIHNDFQFVWGYEDLGDSTGTVLEESNGFRLRVMREYEEVVKQVPFSYTFSAQAVQYDPYKPCYWQTLTYQCDIANDIENEQED